MTHAEALARLDGRGRKKLENNTYLERRGDSENSPIAVRLHDTDVVTIYPDGTYELNRGGWQTVTTKDRINRYSPARLCQKNYQWFLWSGEDKVYFRDRITVDAGGNVIEPARAR